TAPDAGRKLRVAVPDRRAIACGPGDGVALSIALAGSVAVQPDRLPHAAEAGGCGAPGQAGGSGPQVPSSSCATSSALEDRRLRGPGCLGEPLRLRLHEHADGP